MSILKADLPSLNALLPRGVQLDEQSLAKLKIYLTFLTKWNKAINLTGPKDADRIFNELILDSFYLAQFLQTLPLAENPKCYDLGAGAGLPGIPLRLVWSMGSYTLIEIKTKRALFLAQVLANLKLLNTFYYQGSFQDYFKSKNKSADLIVSRAFWPWPKLASHIEPILAPKGIWIILTKNPYAEASLAKLELIASQSYQLANSTRFFWALKAKDPKPNSDN